MLYVFDLSHSLVITLTSNRSRVLAVCFDNHITISIGNGNDDAFTFTKYLDYLKLPTLYNDPDEIEEEEEVFGGEYKENQANVHAS